MRRAWHNRPRGRLAQLEERLVYTQKGAGSSPAPPTNHESIYEELLRFEGGLLSVTRERVEKLSEVARREAQASNIAALEDDSNRYKSRLAIWRRRLTQLETR